MKQRKESDNRDISSQSIQRKSWQDGSGSNIHNNNEGLKDNSQSAKEALQMQKIAESSPENVQLKKWANKIDAEDVTHNDNPIQKKEKKSNWTYIFIAPNHNLADC
jgi:hypothetical protein